MNLVEILSAHARTSPSQAAIIETRWARSRRTTFADLDEQSARAAGLLWQAGLRPGDAVLVFQPMSAELYVALAAIFRLGLVATFLDPSAGREHVERCCTMNPPRALIANPKAHLLRLWSSALRAIPCKFATGLPLPGAIAWSRLRRTPPHPAIHACAPDTPALVTFTSGSTGQPRAVVRSHGFLLAQHRVLARSLERTPADIDLTTLPIVLLANLASRATSVIPNANLRRPDAIDPAPVVRQIQEHGVVTSAASPAFFECLAHYCRAHRLTLPGLRKLFSGGAPVLPRLMDELQQMAPNAEVVSVYGSTEAEPIAHIARHQFQPDDERAMSVGRGLSVGRPVDAIRLRILSDQWPHPVGPYNDTQFAAECLPANQPGEIVVSGDHVVSGYLHGQGDKEAKLRVGDTVWHRTGDAGYLDESGRLWLLGRCAARVEDGHGLLYPLGAELVAYQDPDVRRCALVAHRGRRILTLEGYRGRSPPDLACIAARIAWAAVDEVRRYDRIPVDPRHNAKIDHAELARLLDRDGHTDALVIPSRATGAWQRS